MILGYPLVYSFVFVIEQVEKLDTNLMYNIHPLEKINLILEEIINDHNYLPPEVTKEYFEIDKSSHLLHKCSQGTLLLISLVVLDIPYSLQ